ncbi:MAG: ribosome small subunit-dependent GTPase A [Burkholderiaceae bacterium]|nr:ribosome small subunit-dependent GTPase A [Burkholderiaceae bacterium]
MRKTAARPTAKADTAAALQEALVVATHGRHCLVETASGARLLCHPRGKKLNVVVGDRVHWQPSGDEGSIIQTLPRRNLLYRQDALRTKSFAANLDQALLLLAAEPEFSERQLARALIACEVARITALIALNKADLAAPFARAWARLAPYRAMGYSVLPLCIRPQTAACASGATAAATAATDGLALLEQQLAGRSTLVLGPSGAGKSSLINRLVPGAAAQTGTLSQALASGKHTTTHTRWFWLDQARAAALIDSPGFQEFGLHHIGRAQLAGCMPDIGPHTTQCRFYNCTHLHEPGCGVRDAVVEDADFQTRLAAGANPISASRYKIYSELFAQLR